MSIPSSLAASIGRHFYGGSGTIAWHTVAIRWAISANPPLGMGLVPRACTHKLARSSQLEVCFSLKSGHSRAGPQCPLRVNSRHCSGRDTGAARRRTDQWANATRRSRAPQGCLPEQRAVRPLGQIICQVFVNLAFAWIRSNVSNPSLKEP